MTEVRPDFPRGWQKLTRRIYDAGEMSGSWVCGRFPHEGREFPTGLMVTFEAHQDVSPHQVDVGEIKSLRDC
jgi:hypothetical protein